jgi:hypothetical protein
VAADADEIATRRLDNIVAVPPGFSSQQLVEWLNDILPENESAGPEVKGVL